MKTTPKWLTRTAAIAALALAAGGLAACSSSNNTSSDAKTTINWWSWNPDDNQAKTYITAFEKEHPNITIKHRFIQFADYENAVRLGASSGSGPDVFGLQVGTIANQLAPLTADLDAQAKKQIGSDYTDQLIATDQFKINGKQIGLPWMIAGAGEIWYNKGTLDKAGISAPPKDLAEWQADCTKIEALGQKCFVQGAKDDWVNLDVYQIIANQINPGGFYKAIVGKSKFDSADYIKAFDDWKALFDKGIIQSGALATTQYPDANDMWLKGQAAMIAFGNWNNSTMTTAALSGLASTYGDQVKSQTFVAAPFPDVVGGAKETGRLFGGPDVGWAISAKSKKQDAAFTFVKWLTASKSGQTLMGATLEQPALKSVPVAKTGLVDASVQGPVLEEQSKQLANLIGPRQISNADVQTALQQALSSVASGQMSSKDAAKSVQAAIDAAK
ncbi:ABC transporter substrate-binding protein [Leifsonia sp. TF02-11]|uniref:ABC transporter substrate-binding protein n=1 Tax=Leifsonia sp. TF02-11 TaxID=2815212 RepID=UPI001AA1AAA6|nr:ABC transporter substrate-binding protein [Leifsonia sp. TF02-11]MBO1741563.1 carbohydrate ABC transporter substrate-binding protein [Leifsonia sp. TF02-11]